MNQEGLLEVGKRLFLTDGDVVSFP
jgi:hypothetical protein